MAVSGTRPLFGTRVLDFTHVLAGPVCSRLLADLGADVLKVESQKRPDRPWSAEQLEDLGRTPAFVMVHRGKRSITIDLKTAHGAELARSLAAVADVVVENFSAGVMARLGLDYDRLQALNPRLVYVSMSGYGNDGPRRGWRSMNSILQAHSGLMMANEAEGEAPLAISNSWMDYMGGFHGCFSVLEGLTQRTESGKGCYVDLSQFESGVAVLGANLLAGIVDGKPPPRNGNRSASGAPQGCYRCAGNDQWCVISVETDAQWLTLGAACGNPPWALDPRFKSLIGRLRHHAELDANIEDWTSGLASDEIVSRLKAMGVPAERMRTVADVLAERGPDSVFHLLPHGSRELLLSAQPFGFLPREEPSFEPIPRLGEHTAEGLSDWLGLDVAEIERLRVAEALV